MCSLSTGFLFGSWKNTLQQFSLVFNAHGYHKPEIKYKDSWKKYIRTSFSKDPSEFFAKYGVMDAY